MYLNKILFRFKKVDSPFCSYFNEEETPLHLFHFCLNTKHLWNKLSQYLSKIIHIPHSTQQSSMVGMFDNSQHSMLINYLLLIFKFYIQSGRKTKQLNFDNLKKTIKKIKELEKELSSSNKLKLLNKWRPMDHVIDLYSIQSKKGGRTRVINFISRVYLFGVFFIVGFFIYLFSLNYFFCNVHL